MKRPVFFVLMLFLAAITVFAQSMKKTQRFQSYFDTYKDMAIEQMKKYHVPASITLAQGVLESGAGDSELARNANNHFGIKCNGWQGRKSYHDDDESGECFRAYNSVKESFEDHSLFLVNGKRYSRLFQLKQTDYKGWAKGLKECGYATSPTYATKLIEIIELYGLHDFDTGKGSSSSGSKSHSNSITVELPSRHVYFFNDNYYVYAHQGDTYSSIGKEMGVPAKKLARYNENVQDARLQEGSVVWLEKKSRKAPKDFADRRHVVRAGESMYDISQAYGIRVKYLYKMNSLSPNYVPLVGDQLKLR